MQYSRLDLKAKALLSIVLSLLREWNDTLKGLARISSEGMGAIYRLASCKKISLYITGFDPFRQCYLFKNYQMQLTIKAQKD